MCLDLEYRGPPRHVRRNGAAARPDIKRDEISEWARLFASHGRPDEGLDILASVALQGSGSGPSSSSTRTSGRLRARGPNGQGVRASPRLESGLSK